MGRVQFGTPLLFATLIFTNAAHGQDGELHVDLSGSEYESIDQSGDRAGKDEGSLESKVRDWFRRFEIWGYASSVYLHTGRDGIRPRGEFALRQATLFTRAEITDNASFFLEVHGARWPRNDGTFMTREAYAQISDIVEMEDGNFVSVRVGRIDLPFGEYYLQEDSIDNLLITYPIALPYGVDEGVMAYGRLGGIDWSAALVEGSYPNPSSGGGSRAGVLRAKGRPTDTLSWTASAWISGSTNGSALCFSGATMTPVGKSGTSSLGKSGSKRVDTRAFVLDGKWAGRDGSSLQVSAGTAFVEDAQAVFDRDFQWFTVEPAIQVTEDLKAILRWSEIGTYDSDEGYLFRGLNATDGAALYGYDTKRAQRLSAGLRLKLRENMHVKAEVGRDRFWVIDASSADPGSKRNEFLALEFVFRF